MMIISITIKTPKYIPALKIPSTALHELNSREINSRLRTKFSREYFIHKYLKADSNWTWKNYAILEKIKPRPLRCGFMVASTFAIPRYDPLAACADSLMLDMNKLCPPKDKIRGWEFVFRFGEGKDVQPPFNPSNPFNPLNPGSDYLIFQFPVVKWST